MKEDGGLVSGMSLRDHFAIEIMKSILMSPIGRLTDSGNQDLSDFRLSEISYLQADLMLKERSKCD